MVQRKLETYICHHNNDLVTKRLQEDIALRIFSFSGTLKREQIVKLHLTYHWKHWGASSRYCIVSKSVEQLKTRPLSCLHDVLPPHSSPSFQKPLALSRISPLHNSITALFRPVSLTEKSVWTLFHNSDFSGEYTGGGRHGSWQISDLAEEKKKKASVSGLHLCGEHSLCLAKPKNHCRVWRLIYRCQGV